MFMGTIVHENDVPLLFKHDEDMPRVLEQYMKDQHIDMSLRHTLMAVRTKVLIQMVHEVPDDRG
jgi:hypothetical protein